MSALENYERETLAEIRRQSPQLAPLSDRILCAAYSAWSEDAYCAGWIEGSDWRVAEFIKWALSPKE